MPRQSAWPRTSIPDGVSALRCADDVEVADNRIQFALQMMEDSPDLDLDAIAGTLNLSASRLRHLFSAQIGLSPVQYMKHIKLRQAKSLLESSFLTVKEIAFRVGARDVSHFVRDYKTVYGETPTDARDRSVRDIQLFRNKRLSRQLRLPFGNSGQPSGCVHEPSDAKLAVRPIVSRSKAISRKPTSSLEARPDSPAITANR